MDLDDGKDDGFEPDPVSAPGASEAGRLGPWSGCKSLRVGPELALLLFQASWLPFRLPTSSSSLSHVPMASFPLAGRRHHLQPWQSGQSRAHSSAWRTCEGIK